MDVCNGCILVAFFKLVNMFLSHMSSLISQTPHASWTYIHESFVFKTKMHGLAYAELGALLRCLQYFVLVR